MTGEKRFLRGTCDESGCTKRVQHLRGHADVRVAWVDYLIKAFCGEHAKKWDERKKVWAESLTPDNPHHLFPSSSMIAYEEKAERLAAEQEALERAERQGSTPPSHPTADAIRTANARAPKVVRLA